MPNADRYPRIAVVGPCAAGKSTLVETLRRDGYDVRAVAQEHSYVKDMWRRLARPDILVYLDASLAAITRRREISWDQQRLDALNQRLRHARQHCDLLLSTDGLSAEEVAAAVRSFVQNWRQAPPSCPL